MGQRGIRLTEALFIHFTNKVRLVTDYYYLVNLPVLENGEPKTDDDGTDVYKLQDKITERKYFVFLQPGADGRRTIYVSRKAHRLQNVSSIQC